jgi:hypothetical protein
VLGCCRAEGADVTPKTGRHIGPVGFGVRPICAPRLDSLLYMHVCRCCTGGNATLRSGGPPAPVAILSDNRRWHRRYMRTEEVAALPMNAPWSSLSETACVSS